MTANPTDEEMAALKAIWEAEERELTPLPWRIEHGTQFHELDGWLTEIIGANGDTVADNQRYYPQAVKPVDMEYIVRAVNAHEALVAALEPFAGMQPSRDIKRSQIDAAIAALAAARK